MINRTRFAIFLFRNGIKPERNGADLISFMAKPGGFVANRIGFVAFLSKFTVNRTRNGAILSRNGMDLIRNAVELKGISAKLSRKYRLI